MNLYMFVDKEGVPLYIGKTINETKTRINGHFSEDGHLPVELFEEYENIIHMECANEYELAIKEVVYIGKHKPKFNTQYMFKDDLPKPMLSIIRDDEWINFASKTELKEKTELKIEMCKRNKMIAKIEKEVMQKQKDVALKNHIFLM